jgi:hypothetical protein
MLALVLVAGCLRDTEFHCTSDQQCGSGGQCDGPTGYCTVPDSNCVLGRRYADFSGSDTNKCVLPSSTVDAGPGCAPGFAPLAGVTGHLYRLFSTPSDFNSQRGACSVQGGITYLAIPDDQTELGAIVALAASPTVWVGIDDLVVPNTYQTVRGQPATFLPWATGQPNNAGSADCVGALNTGTLADLKCTQSLPAVCECEP